MKKGILIILALAVLVLVGVALAGMYKFNYLANQPGYDVDGNKITQDMTDTVDPSGDYIGMTVAQAEAKANSENVPFRVVERDGEIQPTTRDIRIGRINATVNDNVVTSYEVETNPRAEQPEQANHDEIIGMTVEQAETYAQEKGVDFRTGSVDGQDRPVTMDYRVGRITANVDEGVVTSYTVE